jgi:hypothetical protein
MFAGRSFLKATEQAKSNAQWVGEPRYVITRNGCYYISSTRPRGVMAAPYDEVRPDGSVIKEIQPKM